MVPVCVYKSSILLRVLFCKETEYRFWIWHKCGSRTYGWLGITQYSFPTNGQWCLYVRIAEDPKEPLLSYTFVTLSVSCWIFYLVVSSKRILTHGITDMQWAVVNGSGDRNMEEKTLELEYG